MNGAGSSRPDDPSPAKTTSSGRRRPIVIAGLTLALLVVAAVAYAYADDLIGLASWLTSSRAIHFQGHIRY